MPVIFGAKVAVCMRMELKPGLEESVWPQTLPLPQLSYPLTFVAKAIRVYANSALVELVAALEPAAKNVITLIFRGKYLARLPSLSESVVSLFALATRQIVR